MDVELASASQDARLPGMPKRRRFRGILAYATKLFVAFVVAPLVLLAVAEFALRAAGYGYDTQPFLKKDHGGKRYYVANTRFFHLFMPNVSDSQLTPSDIVIPAEKAPNTRRVVVLGSSAALGWQFPHQSFSHVLSALLEEAHPGVRFEVFNLAYHCMNSHGVRVLAQECARVHPDLFVVYMGNNEVKGSIGLLYDLEMRCPTWMMRGVVRGYVAWTDLRLAQWGATVASRIYRTSQPLFDWSAKAPYVTMKDPELLRVYDSYRRNIEDICAIAKRAGASVALCTVARNERGIRALDSTNRPDIAPPDRASWDTCYQAGVRQQEAKAYGDALREFQQAAAIDDSHADLLFRMAECYWEMGEYEAARSHYHRSKECDFAMIAAGDRVNDAVRATAVARAGEGAFLVDAVQRFAERSPHGCTGVELLADHCHLTFAGNYELGRVVFERIQQACSSWFQGNPPGGNVPMSLEQCKERLAVTPCHVLDEIGQARRSTRDTLAPNAIAYLNEMESSANEALAGQEPSVVSTAALRRAVELAPNDMELRSMYAQAILGAQPVEAERDARMLVERMPCQWRARDILWHALSIQGKKEEAVTECGALRRLYAAFPVVHYMWGIAMENAGNLPEAASAYGKAASLERVNDSSNMAKARVLEKMGDKAGASKAYEAAATATSQHWICDGVDRFLKENSTPAQRVESWRRIVDRTRKSPVGLRHLYLGMALQAGGDAAAAADAFREAVKLDPSLHASVPGAPAATGQ